MNRYATDIAYLLLVGFGMRIIAWVLMLLLVGGGGAVLSDVTSAFSWCARRSPAPSSTS